MTVSPTVTCPSPPSATFPSRRTARIVVARMMGRDIRWKLHGPVSGASALCRDARIGRLLPDAPRPFDELGLGPLLAAHEPPDVRSVPHGSPQQHERPDNYGHGRVSPCVAPDKRPRHRDSTEPDQDLSESITRPARPAAPLLPNHAVGRERIEDDQQPDEP